MNLGSRHSSATMLALIFGLIWKVNGPLRIFRLNLWRLFSLILPQYVHGENQGSGHKYEQLQNGCHARLLSTWMPNSSKKAPTINSKRNIPHFGVEGSNNSYSGAKTRTSIPASRRASPPISAVLRFSDKITSVHGEGALYHNFYYAAVSSLYSRCSE
jgi:hypothetical protein